MDLVVTGARVRTFDPARPAARAVCVRDGLIVAVGDDDEARAAAAAGAEVLDAGGAALVPGLVDAHIHPFRGTDTRCGLDLSRVETLPELRRVLAEERRRLGPGAWVVGHGLRYEPFQDGGATAAHIDDVLNGAPAALRFFDLHTMLCSSRALELAGIDGPREFAERSDVVCDLEGRPTGELREWAAIALVEAVIPRPDPAERRAAYVATLRAMSAAGLTGGHAMLGDPELLELVAEMDAAGELPVRLRMPFLIDPGMSAGEQDALAVHRDRRGERWTAGVAKFFADGVVESGTAWLHEPDVFGRNDAPYWLRAGAYEEAVRRMAGHGFQCVTHAVGDRAVHAVLDAYRDAPAAASGAPHRVEHLELLRDEELARFAAEGVVVSMQPAHMDGLDLADDPDESWRRAVGADRYGMAFRWADVRRSGAVLALGSDWIVAPFEPLLGMAWARLRRTPGSPGNTPFGPEQALSAVEALEGYTTHAALAAGEGLVAGRIAPGFRGDLTLLAEDPVAVDPDALVDVPVLATVVGGEVVFRAG